jgi:hypothetical protein
MKTSTVFLLYKTDQYFWHLFTVTPKEEIPVVYFYKARIRIRFPKSKSGSGSQRPNPDPNKKVRAGSNQIRISNTGGHSQLLLPYWQTYRPIFFHVQEFHH